MATGKVNSRGVKRCIGREGSRGIGRPGSGKGVLGGCLPMFPGGPAVIELDSSSEDRWLCVLTFQWVCLFQWPRRWRWIPFRGPVHEYRRRVDDL